MRIGVAGPIDLRILASRLPSIDVGRGYPFPYTAHLVGCLLDRGHEISVFALDPESSATRIVTHGPLTAHIVPMRPRARDRAKDFFRAERKLLASEMSRSQVDVVHAHWTYEFALAAAASNRPNVVTTHDWAPTVLRHHRDPYRLVRLGMQVSAISRAQVLTAVSPYIAGKVQRYYKRQPHVVPNAVPQPMMAPPSARCGGGPTIVGAVSASFDRLKNTRALIAAFASARSSLPDGSRLRLVGPPFGPGGPANEWARSRGLDGSVDFIGEVRPADMVETLDSFDVLVHPALEEAFCMAVLEAMARGLPVIGGRSSGAVPWLLAEGECGMLVDVMYSDEISRAILDLAWDPPRRFALGALARERALGSFSMDTTIGAYERCYQLASRRSVPPGARRGSRRAITSE